MHILIHYSNGLTCYIPLSLHVSDLFPKIQPRQTHSGQYKYTAAGDHHDTAKKLQVQVVAMLVRNQLTCNWIAD